MATNDITRFIEKVQVQPNGCWYWTASLDGKGYGNFYYNGRMDKAHKASYSIHKGAVPEGKILDHTCHDPRWCGGGVTCLHRRCVNPDHLAAVTWEYNLSPERGCHHYNKSNIPWAGVNASAEIRKSKLRCPSGHEWTLENTVIRYSYKNGIRYEYRSCHQCALNSKAKRRLKLKNQFSSTPNYVA